METRKLAPTFERGVMQSSGAQDHRVISPQQHGIKRLRSVALSQCTRSRIKNAKGLRKAERTPDASGLGAANPDAVSEESEIGGGDSHQRTRLCFAFSLFCGNIQGNLSNSDVGRRLTSAFVMEIQSLASRFPKHWIREVFRL